MINTLKEGIPALDLAIADEARIWNDYRKVLDLWAARGAKDDDLLCSLAASRAQFFAIMASRRVAESMSALERAYLSLGHDGELGN